MTPMRDSISDIEIDAYLNDQLDLQGRIAVESWLSRNPEAAARVMADLRIRDALRAMTQPEPIPQGVESELAARRLGRGLQRRHLRRGFNRGLLAAACVALGWLVHWQVDDSVGIATTEAAAPPPRFVTEAVQAHRTSLLRAEMVSQLEAPEFDRQEILRNTQIALPHFPADWSVLDVQVYPAALGNSVVVMFRTPGAAGPFSLYMAPMASERSLPLRLSRQGEKQVAWWRVGRLGLALTGQARAVELRSIATAISRGLGETVTEVHPIPGMPKG